MSIVLSKCTHAHHAVQRARWFVTMALAELGKTYRQLAVARDALFEDLHVARAIHRLDGINATVDRLRREHVVAKGRVVA